MPIQPEKNKMAHIFHRIACPIAALLGLGILSSTAAASMETQMSKQIVSDASIIVAQTEGMERRQDRREDRRDDRQDRRDDRQDCRQEEGLVGKDKRDCKQEERQERRD
jgi:hypothetical protein